MRVALNALMLPKRNLLANWKWVMQLIIFHFMQDHTYRFRKTAANVAHPPM